MSDGSFPTSQQPPNGEPPADNGSNKTWLWVALGVVVLIIVGLAVAAIAGNSDGESSDTTTTVATTEPTETTTTTTEATTTTTTEAAPPAQTVTVTGSGQTNSDPFTLTAERYQVAYDYPGDCDYSSTLESTDPATPVSEPMGSGRAVSGETNLFGLAPGEYFIAVSTGSTESCPWDFVLTPA